MDLEAIKIEDESITDIQRVIKCKEVIRKYDHIDRSEEDDAQIAAAKELIEKIQLRCYMHDYKTILIFNDIKRICLRCDKEDKYYKPTEKELNGDFSE